MSKLECSGGCGRYVRGDDGVSPYEEAQSRNWSITRREYAPADIWCTECSGKRTVGETVVGVERMARLYVNGHMVAEANASRVFLADGAEDSTRRHYLTNFRLDIQVMVSDGAPKREAADYSNAAKVAE